MDRARTSMVMGAIVAAAVALDQATKEWALNRLSGGRTISLLPTLELDLTFNSGFSFGTGNGNGRVIGVAVVAVSMGIVWMIARETDRTRATLFAVILGGAVGNLTDRLFRGDGWLRGEVVDFIDVSWYAVFNFADMFVVCGCLALVALELRRPRRHDHEATPVPASESV
jgi:signal peptidase II